MNNRRKLLLALAIGVFPPPMTSFAQEQKRAAEQAKGLVPIVFSGWETRLGFHLVASLAGC